MEGAVLFYVALLYSPHFSATVHLHSKMCIHPCHGVIGISIIMAEVSGGGDSSELHQKMHCVSIGSAFWTRGEFLRYSILSFQVLVHVCYLRLKWDGG